MEQVAIKFDARNIITISICGLLGYVILMGINMAWNKTMTMKGGSAS